MCASARIRSVHTYVRSPLRHFLDPVTRLLSVNIGSDVNNDNLVSGSMFMHEITIGARLAYRPGHELIIDIRRI